jgi:1-deoxy-D-xylulose-5-phosphate synthase
MSPKDEDELADMLYTAMLHDGPVAVRYPRGIGPGTAVKERPAAIPVGKAELLEHSGNDRVAIFSLGAMLPLAREIAGALASEGVAAAVINARFAKPLDVEMIAQYGRSAEILLTLEDHALAGGFGSAVLEELNRRGLSTPVVRIGWPDQFIEHGKPEELRKKYGLTAASALAQLRHHLGIPV